MEINFAAPVSSELNVEKAAETLMVSMAPVPFAQYTERGEICDKTRNWYIGLLNVLIPQGCPVVQSHDHEAVAIWLPPSVPPFSKEDFAAARDPAMEGHGTNLQQIVRMFSQAAIKHDMETTPQWFLKFLTRHPESTTPGAVSCLVKPVLERAAADGTPVVLLCANPSARPIYEKWGFKALEEVRFADGAVTMWYMVKQ